MRKILVALLLIAGPWKPAFATPSVWLSSNTATADTTQVLCPNTANVNTKRAILHAVCVNTGAAGTLTVYNSSATAVNPLLAMNTAAVVACATYDISTSSGLTYTNSATANVTLTYMCY